MPSKTIEVLWIDLLRAKHKLHSACSQVSVAEEEIGGLPAPDGHYGYRLALLEKEEAVMSYFKALENFKAAVLFGWDGGPPQFVSG